MCLVVDYSEKLVKSDYLGVIICNWWRKVRKIGIFANQNAYYTGNSYEDPKYSGFSPKFIQYERFYAEYTKNSGNLMRFFRKIGKFAKLSVQLSNLVFNNS